MQANDRGSLPAFDPPAAEQKAVTGHELHVLLGVTQLPGRQEDRDSWRVDGNRGNDEEQDQVQGGQTRHKNKQDREEGRHRSLIVNACKEAWVSFVSMRCLRVRLLAQNWQG